MTQRRFILAALVAGLAGPRLVWSATLTGKVLHHGPAPMVEAMPGPVDSVCAQGNGKKPMTPQTSEVNANGTLRDAFVYVEKGAPVGVIEPRQVPVRLEQVGCRFVPHVVAVEVGQPLELVNRDDTYHTVIVSAKINPSFNLGLADRDQVVTRTFLKPEQMLSLKCGVHPWATAYVAVMSHPYFAVTDQEGRFTIKNLPPGNYTIAVWAEGFGVETEKIKVEKEGASQTLNFTL